MNILIEVLKRNIEQSIEDGIKKGKQRFLINFLPESIINRFFEEVEFLLEDKIPYLIISDEIASGRYDGASLKESLKLIESDVNKARTKLTGKDILIVFSSPKKILQGSLETTFEKISSPFNNVVSDLTGEIHLGDNNFLITTIIGDLIKITNPKPGETLDVVGWEILEGIEKLFLSKGTALDLDEILSYLGVIYGVEEAGSKQSIELLEKMAKGASNMGFKSFYNDLKEGNKEYLNDNPIINHALEQFYEYVYSNGKALYLSDNPHQVYSNEKREWWKELSIVVWNELLENKKNENESDFFIIPSNQLFIDKQAKISIFEEHAQLGISKNGIDGIWSINKENLNDQKEPRISISKENFENHELSTLVKFDTGTNFRRIKCFSLASNTVPVYFKFDSVTKVEKRVWVEGEENECSQNFRLKGLRKHQLQLYVGRDWECIEVIGVDISSTADKETNINLPRTEFSESRLCKIYNFDNIFTDEDCQYMFKFKTDKGKDFIYLLQITTQDDSIQEVNSYFKFFVEKHLGKKSIEIKTPNTRLTYLESILLKEPETCLPLLISIDFHEFEFRKLGNGVLTNYELDEYLDPRPPIKEFHSHLENLIEIRSRLISLLAKNLSQGQDYLEEVNLPALDPELKLESIIEEYLLVFVKSVSDPLTKDYAFWFETITILDIEGTGVLSYSPSGLFLSPFHPICIAWQYYGQKVLSDSLNQTCPIAGLLNPSNIPSVWSLKNKNKEYSFLSINTNLDYWRLYSNESTLTAFSQNTNNSISNLLSSLEVKFDILERGMKSNQIERALSQLHHMYPSKTTKTTTILGTNDHSNEVNNGLLEWIKKNYGNDSTWESINFWKSYQAYGMDIYDERTDSILPESSYLSHFINELKIPLRWFRGGLRGNTDFSIISQLNINNQRLEKEENLKSCLAIGGLYRVDSKKNIQGSGIIRSLVSLKSGNEKGISNLLKLASYCVEKQFENLNGDNSIYYNPDKQLIDKALTNSDVCAVSSTMIDTAFIISGGERTIWEFDLPSYGGNRAGSDGYYLISETRAIYQNLFIRRVRGYDDSMKKIGSDKLKEYYQYLLSYGSIALKRFIQGGSGTTGEIGILAAHLLLQPFDKKNSFQGLFPVTNKDINLMVPADPFQERIESLKRGMGYKSMNRPDYFLFSLNRDKDEICISALEVKCRTNSISEQDLHDILKTQATESVGFLKQLYAKKDTLLWAGAFPSLINEMISFSLNLYIANQALKEEIQLYFNSFTNKLFNGEIKIKFIDNGKLIAVMRANISYQLSPNIFIISKGDLHLLANGDYTEFFKRSTNLKETSILLECNKSLQPEEKSDLDNSKSDKWVNTGENTTNTNQNDITPIKNPQNETSSDKTVLKEKVQGTTGKGMLTVEDLVSKYNKILETLEEHNVGVKRVENNPFIEGPAFIMFRIIPKRGVKVSKVESVHDEMKLNLKLDKDQFIKFDIEGGFVNIIVPKRDKERYYVQATDLWKEWIPNKENLEIPIGEGILGDIVKLNFSSSITPHLLIGGQTGSGKSEALNTILYGIKEKFSPEEIKFLIVDPKGTELQGFEGLPYTLGKVGYDGDDAIEYLNHSVAEMDRRYKLMKENRTRSLAEYNRKVDGKDKIPWWLVILDEYGDLTHSKESKNTIEGLLTRIAQKGRACGIHLIVTTQNPTANVISSNIRSNLGAQLALKVRGRTESNIILTQSGAETLNGKGDAILNSGSGTTRLQVAICK